LLGALCTDNTSSMRRLWALFVLAYPGRFAIGCCAHVGDLLIEDIVKIVFFAMIVGKVHKYTVFMKTYSLIWEWFLTEGNQLFGVLFAVLVLFPLTRFAYAALMTSRCRAPR